MSRFKCSGGKLGFGSILEVRDLWKAAGKTPRLRGTNPKQLLLSRRETTPGISANIAESKVWRDPRFAIRGFEHTWVEWRGERCAREGRWSSHLY